MMYEVENPALSCNSSAIYGKFSIGLFVVCEAAKPGCGGKFGAASENEG